MPIDTSTCINVRTGLLDRSLKRSARNVSSVVFMKEHNAFRRNVLCELTKRCGYFLPTKLKLADL